jgi:hypothetical protein
MDSEGVSAGPETASFLEGFGKSQKNKSKFSVMKNIVTEFIESGRK